MAGILSLTASLLAAVSVLTLVGGIAKMRKPNAVRDRLDWAAQRVNVTEGELRQPLLDRTLRPLLGGIASPIMRMAPRNSVEHLQRQIASADLEGSLDASTFMALRSLAGIGFGLLAAILVSVMGLPLSRALMMGAGTGGLAFMVPAFWLGGKARKRQDEIRASLPDALDLLTMCIDSMNLDRAIGRVVEKSRSAMRDEFARLQYEVKAGAPLADALRGMARRAGVEELTGLVTTITQTMQLGTQLGPVLRGLSEDMRVRRRQRAETLARQAPIKMMFPMVFLIFPPLFIVILGPSIPMVLHALAPGIHL